MAFITPVALLWLLWVGRWAEAFLIVWPMLYVLASLGILYVEPRYIRYAGLTYLLALPIVLTRGMDILLSVSSRRRPEPRYLRRIVGSVGLGILVVGAVVQFLSMEAVAQSQALSDRLNTAELRWRILSDRLHWRALLDMTFTLAIPAVDVSRTSSGLEVNARAPDGRYLLTAPIGAETNGTIAIRYRVTLQRGAIGFGVFSADGGTWLSYRPLSGAPGNNLDGMFVSFVNPGSSFVVVAQDTGDELRATIGRLEWAVVCTGSFSFLGTLFGSEPVEPVDCPVSDVCAAPVAV